MRTVQVRIEGRVQGVGYRVWMQRTAIEHGLRGWVRNRRDGAVEAVIEGSEADVAAMLEACRQGPRPAAFVERVEIVADIDGGFTGFEVRETV